MFPVCPKVPPYHHARGARHHHVPCKPQGSTIPPCPLNAPGALPSHPEGDARHQHVDHLAPHCLRDSWPAPRDLPSDITQVVARHCTAALGPGWCRGVYCGPQTADTMATSCPIARLEEPIRGADPSSDKSQSRAEGTARTLATIGHSLGSAESQCGQSVARADNSRTIPSMGQNRAKPVEWCGKKLAKPVVSEGKKSLATRGRMLQIVLLELGTVPAKLFYGGGLFAFFC